MPDAMELSESIKKFLMFNVFLTCVPPQSSYEFPNFIVLTFFPYFSPKSPIAPSSIAFL